MDFFELSAFLALKETLHFTKAAEEINLSPSALSRLITRLESEMGIILFERNNRDVVLTEDGKRFAEFATKCLAHKTEMMEEFSQKGDEISGTLHIYASVTACYTIMPPFIKILSERYPKIQISVETGDPAGAISAVKEGRAELAVAAFPDTYLDAFDCIPVLKSPLVFAASANGPYKEVSGSPQDIVSSVPLILPKTGLARNRFDAWVKSRNVKPNISAESEGNEAVLALASLGLGMGLVPKIVVENGSYGGTFICHPTGNILGYYDIGFIQRSVITGSSLQKKIRSAVNEILHQTDWKSYF